MNSRKKVPVQETASPLQINPFANLQIEGLPPGPVEVPKPVDSHAKSAETSGVGEVILRRETAHRGGKPVLILTRFDLRFSDCSINELAREMKVRFGCGGTVKDREIELQTGSPDRVREFLLSKGFRVRGEC